MFLPIIAKGVRVKGTPRNQWIYCMEVGEPE